MGAGSWDASAWTTYSTTAKTVTRDKLYTARGIKDNLSPLNVNVRESRDSIDNPLSTAIAVALDVTESMGMIAEKMAKEGLGTLFQEILDRKPVTNPHLMFMAVGDANCDDAPLQVSQFEADNRIIEQLTSIYLEGGGGGNSFESYDLPWYFAAQHTSIDCFEKRGKKGFLFTIGDEETPPGLKQEQIKKICGDDVERYMTSAETLAMAQRTYHVFHIIVAEGSHCRYPGKLDIVTKKWQDLLGQNVLVLSDYTKLSEVIVSAIQVVEGSDHAAVVDSWAPATSAVVGRALATLTGTDLATTAAPSGKVVRL